MRAMLLFLDEVSSRLDRRSRRMMLFVCMAGLTLFARTTVQAMQATDLPNTVAGLALLLLFAAGSALACSRRG